LNRILSLLISFYIVGLLIGCAPVEEPPKTSGEVMNVAKNYWPGQFWIEIAYEKGWFDEAELNVKLVDTNEDYFQGVQDTADGHIDTNQLVLFDLMDSNLRGANLVAVMNSDISSGADGVVATKDIQQVADLKGKRIGIQKGTFTEFMAQTMLENSGVGSMVEFIEVESDSPQPFIDKTVDALVTWDPHLETAVKQGSGRILFDSLLIPGMIPDLHVFKKQFIEERPEDVQAYINVWHRTTQYIKSNPDQAFQIIADVNNVPINDVKKLAEKATILDLAYNKQAFLFSNDFESLHGTSRKINNFMIEKGITDKQMDTTQFLDARFIRGVEE
jgi:NitT/TauT family transport system substrate-binding protein